MDSPIQLSLPNRINQKILHLTDTHLFGSENGSLLGVNTNASFQAVINEIENKKIDFDLIVATGDFVQDGSESAYVKFVQRIKLLNKPCLWLAGNHDVYPYMSKVFNQYPFLSDKVVLLGEHWLIVLLNSQVEGKAHGCLSEDELKRLQETLQAYPNRNALIFLHHHPVMSGCRWLDQHCLKNHEQFEQIIKAHQNIKAVGWGHIHQQQDIQWHHCKAFSTPSTCVQFKPECHNFKLSADSPGWRIIDLDDQGHIETNVECISSNIFLPDMSTSGY